MRRVLAPLALFALALVGLVAAGPWRAVAQHGSPTAGHAGHGGGHGAGTPTTSP